MDATTLRLLGPPAVLDGEVFVPLPTDLRTALVGVLAQHGAPVSRGRLAAIFWPDTAEPAARQNLRQLLHRTRALLQPGAIEATPTNVELSCDHDLRSLQAAIAARDAVSAASLAAAPLLDGLELVPNREWQAWLALERSQLVEAARRLLLEAAREWAQVGPPPDGVTVLATWVDRDWFDDEMQTAYLQCARLVPGEAKSAAARLARVSAFLEREVGAGLAESVVLASTWLGERTASSAATPSPREVHPTTLLQPIAPGSGPPQGAHAPAAPFRSLLGREGDLRRLDEAFADDSVRLVTVHGPGGIGKTRLVEAWAAAGGPVASEAAAGDAAGASRAPLPVVGLAGAWDVHDAARLLAQAHGWQVGDVDAVGQLVERLADAQRVIVLDEVEGLAYLRDWLTALLAAAPGLKVVVTSRELLGVEGEYVLRLSGLPLPDADRAPAVASAPAVRLFLRAARAVRPDLDFGPDELEAIARFARRVDGSPFALTVAAAWLQLGPPSALLDGVLDDHDDPLAIADVMSPSWSRLEAPEQAALAALAVFPDRFAIEAALAVAACSRQTLRRLVDRSLVQPGTSEGLALHALVRHHAARRLAADRQAEEAARERHARYVAERHSRLAASLWHGHGQWHAYTTLLAQIQDLRQAWRWACEHDAVDLLDGLADAVWCLEIRGWYRLGAELTEAALDALERSAASGGRRAELTLARMLARRGIFAQRLGDVATTRATAEAARAIFERHRSRVDPFVYFHLGIAAHFDGDVAAAEAWHHRLVAEAEVAGDAWAAAGGIGNLALLARDRGDMDEACSRGRQAFDAAIALEDGWLIGIAAANLASMLAERGDSDADATRLAELAIAWAERYSMETLLVEASITLGALHERSGRDLEGEQMYARALALLDAGVLAGAQSPEHGASEDSFRGTIEAGLRRLRAEPD